MWSCLKGNCSPHEIQRAYTWGTTRGALGCSLRSFAHIAHYAHYACLAHGLAYSLGLAHGLAPLTGALRSWVRSVHGRAPLTGSLHSRARSAHGLFRSLPCGRVKIVECAITLNTRSTGKRNTVFSLISAPGAFEIEKWHCHFTLQLAPPFDINVHCYLTFFTMNTTWNIRIIR